MLDQHRNQLQLQVRRHALFNIALCGLDGLVQEHAVACSRDLTQAVRPSLGIA